MSQRINGRQFLDSDGVEDWRAIWGGGWACTHFRTESFGDGVALVKAIGEVAASLKRSADVDLRPEGVSVRVFSGEIGELSEQDVELARAISLAAQELGLRADPSVVQHVQVTIDALVIPEVLPFWQAVLGYAPFGDADVIDPLRRGPTFWFQQMDAPRPGRNRFHVDVYVPHDEVEARITAALAVGGRIVDDSNAPGWWTLADSEGNEVDLAIWMAD